jgi:CRP/FNR family transcriptional regulator
MEEKSLKCLAAIPDTFFPVERFLKYIHLGTVKTYAKGSAIIMPGEITQTLMFVVSGKLRINKFIDDGRERLVYVAGKYGLVGRLYETCNDIYVLAMDESQVCFFTKQQLKEAFRLDEELIFDVLKNYLTKVSFYMKQAAEMDYFNPTVRVVRLFYELHISSGSGAGNFSEINTDLTLKSISEITGAHYVTVSKVLGYLKKQNIMEKKKHTIIIYDVDRLKALTHETHILQNNKF